MKIKAYNCPSCGAPLDVEYDTTFTEFPHCSCEIHISYEGDTAPKNPGTREIIAESGVVLGWAVIPSDYKIKASIETKWQSDCTPFNSIIQVISPDNNVVLVSGSAEVFEDYLISWQKKMLTQAPNANLSTYRDYMEPDLYVKQFAESTTGIKLEPVAKAVLPSRFGNNIQGERNMLLNIFNSHAININVRLEVSDVHCEALCMKYKGNMAGTDVVVICGADFQRLDYYDANRTSNGTPNMFGALGNLYANQSLEEPKNAFDWFMRGGVIGQMQRKKQREAETDTKSSSGKADVIRWGSKRRYLVVAPVEREEEAGDVFLKFVSTFMQDDNLTKQENMQIEQMHQSRVMEAQGMAAQAQQMRLQSMQFQINASRQISRDLNSISDGIMDSWNQKNAAESRMSANYSEAVRGVNSYTTTDGRTVEADVVADHVYQSRYGDTIGVSGSAIDPELASKLNWTELNRK